MSHKYVYVVFVSNTDINSDSGIFSRKTWTRTISTIEKDSDSGIRNFSDGTYVHML